MDGFERRSDQAASDVSKTESANPLPPPAATTTDAAAAKPAVQPATNGPNAKYASDAWTDHGSKWYATC